MAENLRIGRMYFVLLAIFTIGRFVQGAMGVPYAKAHHVFTIVVLTFLASVFYGAFCRRWQGFTVRRAMALGATFGLVAQVVIFTATLVSYLAGAHTYFNNPRALNIDAPDAVIPLAQAMAIRARGLVAGPVTNAIIAALGWAFGGMLPDGAPARAASVVPAAAAPRIVA